MPRPVDLFRSTTNTANACPTADTRLVPCLWTSLDISTSPSVTHNHPASQVLRGLSGCGAGRGDQEMSSLAQQKTKAVKSEYRTQPLNLETCVVRLCIGSMHRRSFCWASRDSIEEPAVRAWTTRQRELVDQVFRLAVNFD